MPNKRYKIESVCPECGCGLIEKMTPDEYVKKYGETTQEVDLVCPDCGKKHKVMVSREED